MMSKATPADQEMTYREIGDQLWTEGFEAREEHKTMKAYHKFSAAMDAYRLIDRDDDPAK